MMQVPLSLLKIRRLRKLNPAGDRPEIRVRSGGIFNLIEPNASVLSIDDIAHSLSHMCRFAGHTRVFYSVAQHSALVSALVPEPFALAGLLHDISESILVDIPTPLKRLLPEYRVIEERVERALFAKFGVSFPLDPCIKRADQTALVTEQRDLCDMEPSEIECPEGVSPLFERIVPMTSEQAYRAFMERYDSLVCATTRAAA